MCTFSSGWLKADAYCLFVISELTIKCVSRSLARRASSATSPVSLSCPNFLIVPVPCHNCTTFTLAEIGVKAIGINSLSRNIVPAVAIWYALIIKKENGLRIPSLFVKKTILVSGIFSFILFATMPIFPSSLSSCVATINILCFFTGASRNRQKNEAKR